MKINRLQLMKMHALLAAFILPVTVMFALTGALYTWGIKGTYHDDVIQVALDKPLIADVDALQALAISELQSRSLALPEGKARLKQYGNHFLVEWTGSSKDVIVEPIDNPLVAQITTKHTSWYRNLVQLHKAKGGDAFKIYAAIFASALGLLLISGFIMALQVPSLKKATLVSAGIGILSFIFFAILS